MGTDQWVRVTGSKFLLNVKKNVLTLSSTGTGELTIYKMI